MKNTTKIFFRNFIPLVRRMIVLLFKAKNKPSIKLIKGEESPQSISVQVKISVRTENLLFLEVNKEVMPVFSDNILITLLFPSDYSEETISFRGIGFFKSTSKVEYNVKNQLILELNSPIDFRPLTGIPKVRTSYVLISNSAPELKTESIEFMYVTSPALEKTVNIKIDPLEIKLDSSELTNQLKTNQIISYE